MFPKVLKKILWILLWGGLLAFPTLEASAQFDASAILRNQNNQNPNDPNNPNNMLGSNPFQTQNGEEQPAMPTDSTKKSGFESLSNPIFQRFDPCAAQLFVDDLAGLQPGAYQSARYHPRHFPHRLPVL